VGEKRANEFFGLGATIMNRLLFVVAASIAILCVSANANAGINLVTNGAFGTGDFTGWTVSAGSTTYPSVGPYAGTDWTDVTSNDNGIFPVFYPHPWASPYFAEFGDTPWVTIPGPEVDIIQWIPTIQGQEYHFGWWLVSEFDTGPTQGYPLTPNDMNVSWNGQQISDQFDFESTTWTPFCFTEVATSNLTEIQFSGYDAGLFLGLDNVNVEAIPEPATLIVWSLLGATSWLGMRVWQKGRRVGRQPWSSENRTAILEIIGKR
jgi:hypothetical protein